MPGVDSREVPAAAGLAVREVTVSFGGIKALEDVSVEAAGGEVVGVIGPNGAGKTTLFNVICGFVAPNSLLAVNWERSVSLVDTRTGQVAPVRETETAPPGTMLLLPVGMHKRMSQAQLKDEGG